MQIKVTITNLNKWEDNQGPIAFFIFRKGEIKRLFRWDRINNIVTQVVADLEPKKGRPNMLGVYRISENSFVTNYYWHLKPRPMGLNIPAYLMPTTEKLFHHYVNLTINRICK